MMIFGRLENDTKLNIGIGYGHRTDLVEAYPLLAIWCFKMKRRSGEGEVGLLKKNSTGFYFRITLLGIKFDRRV